MSEKLNYVIAAFGGPRRSDDKRAQGDRTYFLRKHLEHLNRVKHNLAQITIVVPFSDENPEPEYFTEYLKSLPFPVIRRKNAGYSYGSFAEAFERTRDQFDGYIFVEDDYIFAIDDFDTKLVEIAKREQAEFVCGAVLPFSRPGEPNPIMHPGIALGYCSSKAMTAWANFRDPMPHMAVLESYQIAEYWQVLWGEDFTNLGLKMIDWLSDYASAFWCHTQEICWFGRRESPSLVMPLQAEEKLVERYGYESKWRDEFFWDGK